MEKLNFENKNTNEKEPEIILHFFRHSEKESDKNKTDEEINLTPNGRKMAVEHASDETNISQSVAFGSPKKRTQETALYQMLGSKKEITGELSFDDLKTKVNESLRIGSKVGVDKNLDFPDIEMSQYKTIVYDAFKKGEYIPLLAHEKPLHVQ
jgi:broad specificity phosphatase PhoE